MQQLDYAIQMERDGYEFYVASAKRMKNEAAKRILESLAQDEKRHEEVILQIKEGRPKMIVSGDFARIKNVFAELVEQNGTLFDEGDDLSSVLKKGAGMEKKSAELYGEFAARATDPDEKEVWECLEVEEQTHERLLTMTCEYVDHPDVVLEDAEMLWYGHDEAP